jgi:hypothetical protein
MNKIEEINEIIKVPLHERTEENQSRLLHLFTKDFEEEKSRADILAEIMLKVYGFREEEDFCICFDNNIWIEAGKDILMQSFSINFTTSGAWLGDNYIDYKNDFVVLEKTSKETIVEFANRVGKTLTEERNKFNKNIDIVDKFQYTQTFIKKYINLYYRKKFKLKRVDVEATINRDSVYYFRELDIFYFSIYTEKQKSWNTSILEASLLDIRKTKDTVDSLFANIKYGR